MNHAAANFELFDKPDDLSAWPTLLDKRLPEAWLDGIKTQKTILPYPVAEVGVNSSKGWDYVKEIQNLGIDGLDDDRKSKACFLIALLAQHNFYTNAKQTMLLNIGRVFELLIASIVGPLSGADIHAILGRSPFFSTAALAPTKTILFDENTPNADEESERNQGAISDVSPMVFKLQEEIEAWRQKCCVDKIDLSPWLVYKVFNKVFSQVASGEKISNGMRNVGRVLNIAAHAFYATWFAFGSFEKGPLFGLKNVVATTNVNPENLKNYEGNEQYNINVKPMLDVSKDEESLKAVAVVLEQHPLKVWVDDVIKLNWPKSAEEIDTEAEKCLRRLLAINAKSVTKNTVITQARKLIDELNFVYHEMKTNFGVDNKYTKILKEVWDELNRGAAHNLLRRRPPKGNSNKNTPAETARPQPEVSLLEQEQTSAKTAQSQPEASPLEQEQTSAETARPQPEASSLEEEQTSAETARSQPEASPLEQEQTLPETTQAHMDVPPTGQE